MHTTFNVFPYLITLLLAKCEGTTVLYTTGIFTGWCYMKDILSVGDAFFVFPFHASAALSPNPLSCKL